MIREMDANDLKSIFDFEREYFKSDAYSMETLAKFVSDKNILNLVYDCQEKLLGYINVSFYEDTANILKIAVAINSRRNGIGEELFKSALKILKEKQVKKVFLEVESDNLPAITLYKKLGFKNLRVRKNYYKNGGDAVEMMHEI